MIQATLIFLLGFLAAGFLAVLVAPSIWRRAVKLTRRRIEAALPLSMAEIGADKDAMRAEYAMATRKLEVTVKALKTEIAAQSLDVDRARDETRRALVALDEKEAARADLEQIERELSGALEQARREIARLAEALAGRDRLLEERAEELARLGAMYDEASFDASERQIELVGRESDIERLSGELSELDERHGQTGARLREADARIKELDHDLRGEKRKIIALERKVAKLTAALSDREEKLDRRERDLASVREKLKGAEESGRELAARLSAAQDRQVRLDQDLAAQARKRGAGDGAEGTALLRERIDALAAEMVSLTARLEGPGSPIEAALASADDGLAGRIRALQKAAGAKTAGPA